MKLKVKFIDHGPVDVTDLLAVLPKISQIDWNRWKLRNEPTIPFVFLNNNANVDDFDKIETFDKPIWLKDIVYPLGQELAERFNGKIFKLMLIAVEPNAPNGFFHKDAHSVLRAVHRFHMPLIQSDETKYHVDGEEFSMQVGHWYEKDNTRTHAVINYAEPRERRISLQCDIFPLDNSRSTKFPEYYY